MKEYALYLDDIRDPKTDKDWNIVRGFHQAVDFVQQNGCPIYVSFDHDLGEEQSGYDFAKWLVEKDMNEPGWIPSNFEFNVHSANPIGTRNINMYLTNYLVRRKMND